MHSSRQMESVAAGPAGGRDRNRAYRAARTHSGLVRAAKLALPTIAVLVAIVSVGYVWLSNVAPDVNVDLSGASIRDGKLVMANPKLDGFTAEGKPYSVRAARAIQDLTGGKAIDLERIQAVMPMGKDMTATIEAPTGAYDSEANTLDVTKTLSIATTDGKRADFGTAAIDLAGGNLSTDDPVRISMPGAELTADSMQVEDRGKRMLFEKSVKLVVQPSLLKPSPSSDKPKAGSGG